MGIHLWVLMGLSLLGHRGWSLTSPHVGDEAFLSVVGNSEATGPSNCMPFGDASLGNYKGFIYSGVGGFTLYEHSRIAFDLGAVNNKAIVLDLALAATSTDGGTAVSSAGFTPVCSACTPASPKGDAISGNFELEFELNVDGLAFNFAGGGLVVRFAAAGSFASDFSCSSGVLMSWDATDASGYFVERFYSDSNGMSPWSASDATTIGGFALYYAAPTSVPSQVPAPLPTKRPTEVPTRAPTPQPTPKPSIVPLPLPSAEPTQQPSPSPSMSFEPTAHPSHTPSPTQIPTTSTIPTLLPSAPSELPTLMPSAEPTLLPAPIPTRLPSLSPSYSPSRPTGTPTSPPSPLPSPLPFPVPTSLPQPQPSALPIPAPTPTPSLVPSPVPTPWNQRSISAYVSCNSQACSASTNLDLTEYQGVSAWTSLSLTVDRLRGDLSYAGIEFATLWVNDENTGYTCSTQEDCGGTAGMYELAGDDCVVNLDLSPWVSVSSSSEVQDKIFLAVELKATSAVNSCSPHMAARISVAVTYQATPPPTEARIPSPKPSMRPYFQPTLSRMPTDKPSSTTSPIYSPTLAPSSANTISVSVELLLEASSSEPSTDDKIELQRLIANVTGSHLDSVRSLTFEVTNSSSFLPSRRLLSFSWMVRCFIYADSTVISILNFTAMVESGLTSDDFELPLVNKLAAVTSVRSVSTIPATRQPLPIPSILSLTFPTPQPTQLPSLKALSAPTSAPLCNGCASFDDQANNTTLKVPGTSSAYVSIELLLAVASISITFSMCLCLYAFVSMQMRESSLGQSTRDDVAQPSTQRTRMRRIPHKRLWRTARYKASGAGNVDRICSICISDIGDHEFVKELRCTHFYHARCLDSWLSVSVGICPLCKDPALAPNPPPWREALADNVRAASYALGWDFQVQMAADASSDIELVNIPSSSQQTSNNGVAPRATVDDVDEVAGLVFQSTITERSEEDGDGDSVNIDSYFNQLNGDNHESEPIEMARTSPQREFVESDLGEAAQGLHEHRESLSILSELMPQEIGDNSVMEEGSNTLSPHTFEESSLILERLRVHEQGRQLQHLALTGKGTEREGSEEEYSSYSEDEMSGSNEADQSKSSEWGSSTRNASTGDKMADDRSSVSELWDDNVPDEWNEEEDD